MPPRFAYWTILIDNAPTAFRARDREELLPTLHQLKRKSTNVVLKWFARGRLWESQQAERDSWRAAPPKERRGKDWRPGGDHKDPRARFDKEKRRRDKRDERSATPSSSKPAWSERPKSPQRPWSGKPRAPKQPWTGKPKSLKPWGERPTAHGTRPRDDRWRAKPHADKRRDERAQHTPHDRRPDERPWHGKPATGGPRDERAQHTPYDRRQDERPWHGKPGTGRPHGKRPWNGPRKSGDRPPKPWQKEERAPTPAPAPPPTPQHDAKPEAPPMPERIEIKPGPPERG